jgi:hypothetical protein
MPRWADRYARNRTLPAFIFFGVIAALVTALAVLSCLVDWSLRAGDATRGVAFVLLLAGVFAGLLWFRFVSGAQSSRRIAEAVYGNEGSVVTEAMEQSMARPEALSAAHFALLFCVLVWLGLSFVNLIPNRHMLPTSAVFLVPFSFYFYAVKYRELVSPFMLLYPTLYGLHAILLSLGARIYFSGGPGGIYEGLNLIIPIIGYALLAALAGHLYSRLALRRLRALARASQPKEGGEG